MDVQVIKPRLLPRDAMDWLTAAGVSLIYGTVSLAIPMALSSEFTGDLVAALLFALCWNAFFAAFTVTEIELSVDGIRFKRLFGGPRFLAWREIDQIREASRSEVVLKGWLWPMFVCRAASLCFSSSHQYRIGYSGSYCFFAPEDRTQFEAAVRKFREAAKSPGLSTAKSIGIWAAR